MGEKSVEVPESRTPRTDSNRQQEVITTEQSSTLKEVAPIKYDPINKHQHISTQMNNSVLNELPEQLLCFWDFQRDLRPLTNDSISMI